MYKNFKFYKEVEEDIFVEEFYTEQENFEQKSNQEVVLRDLLNFLPKFINPNVLLLEKSELEKLEKETATLSLESTPVSSGTEKEEFTDKTVKDLTKGISLKIGSPLSSVLKKREQPTDSFLGSEKKKTSTSDISSSLPSTQSNFFKRKSMNSSNTPFISVFSGEPKRASSGETLSTTTQKRTTSLVFTHKITEEEFKEKVHISDHQSLTNFISNSYGELSPIVKILKLSHQGIVVGFLSQLGAELLYNYGMRYKDVKNSWFIKVTRHVPKEDTDEYISVAHTRSEEVVVMTQDSTLMTLFKFTWILEMEFDSVGMNEISKIKSSILSFDWDSGKNTIPPEIIVSHEKKFRFYFDNPKPEKIKVKGSLTPTLSLSDERDSTFDHLFSVSRLICNFFFLVKFSLAAIKMGSSSDVFQDAKLIEMIQHFTSIDLSQQKKILDITPKPKNSVQSVTILPEKIEDEITKYLCLSHVCFDNFLSLD
jgi:hypothetical protein